MSNALHVGIAYKPSLLQNGTPEEKPMSDNEALIMYHLHTNDVLVGSVEQGVQTKLRQCPSCSCPIGTAACQHS